MRGRGGRRGRGCGRGGLRGRGRGRAGTSRDEDPSSLLTTAESDMDTSAHSDGDTSPEGDKIKIQHNNHTPNGLTHKIIQIY